MDIAEAELVVIVTDPKTRRRSALAVRGGIIVQHADSEEDLESWRGPLTRVVEREGHLRPLFVDTHNHLALASRDRLGVPLSEARSIADLLDGIRERASRTPDGGWIVTAAAWHEQQLVEGRLPTAAELDTATTRHPVLVQRGGHNGAVNTAGLLLSGLDVGPGAPLGIVQDEALTVVQRFIPEPEEADLVAAIEATSLDYLSHGIGTVRDAAVTVSEWHALRRAALEGRLHVRTHAMIFTPTALIEAAGSIDRYLDDLESRGLHPGQGEDRLRLWGLKLVLDGGVEAAALREPYPGRPDFRGTLLMQPEALTEVLAACDRRGWPVGAHAFGDAAIDVFLDAVETTGSGSAILEHAGLITGEQLQRTVALGVPVTAQQALLDALAVPLIQAWGRERAERLFPWRALVDAGIQVSAGTDHPIGPLDPVRAFLGMTDRITRAGVLGADQAISSAEALRLCTEAGAALLGAPLTGRIDVGSPADFAVYPRDLESASRDELDGVEPALVVLDGRVVLDRVL